MNAPPGLVGGYAPEPPLKAAAAPADGGLAASPWNTANNPGFNRDLLPSAMLAPKPEPEPASKRGDARPGPAAEAPSRTPWIIVGVLVLVAVAGGVAVFQLRAKHGSDGQIAVPAGASTVDDTPADTEAPAAATATAKPKAAPVVHPVYRPKPANDDPYADPYGPTRRPAPAPASTPTAAPHRIFGTEN